MEQPTRDTQQENGGTTNMHRDPNASQQQQRENGGTQANDSEINDRRRSDSNIFGSAAVTVRNGRDDTTSAPQSYSKRRPSQLSSRPVLPQETWQQQRLGSFGKRYQLTPPPNKPAPSQLQEDTFYQNLEIRLHHSVGSMSISPSSRDVVLAGRQGLLIIDLEDPWLLPRILPHLSKWEVADVQWSPYISRESWVASTSNQKLLVWNLNYSGTQAIEHVLHAHSRAITDINWSPHHPDMLATCSVDTYVHIWDLRCAGQSKDDQSMRPAHSFTSWNAATTQVKFNRKSEYLLASAHDKDVKIWDIRKGAIPVTSIEAHTKKIYGIDWSRHNSHDIVTCSLDQLVKYWNINFPEKEQETIMTNTPVWRARNTPFGNGVLTMPQRSENTLYLYSRSSPGEPVHAFEGHTDIVKEFVWRWKGGAGNDGGGDDREFQLVTWSKDQNLRLWPITEDIMKSVGHTPSSKRTTARVPVTADEPRGSYPSRSFQQVPDEAGETPTTESFLLSSSTSLQGGPGGNEVANAGAVPFRNGGASTGFTSGYDVISGAYREQRYAINPLLWMQNVKKVGPPSELKNAKLAENTYQTVAEEMATVLPKYANAGVKIEKAHPANRCCTISLQGPWSDTGAAFLRITIRFSAQYPDNKPPEFEIQKNSMMSIYHRAHMLQDLNNLAASYTSKKRWCLEACIRYLLGETSQEEADLELGEHARGKANEAGGFGNWNGTSGGGAGIDNGDSDEEFFGGAPFLGMGGGAAGGAFGASGKRSSMQSEKGIVVDMSTKQSADEKVPFPRLCGGVFSGNGQLVCFFSTLRVRDAKRRESRKGRPESDQEPSPTSNNSNAEYFENTYSDFYKHPRTYEQFEEYKEIAAMSRQGRNATVLVGGSGGAFGEYAYDDDPDDMDDGLATMTSLYLKPDGLALGGSISNGEDLMYRGSKAERITHQVNIMDLSNLMPFDSVLATEYKLSFENPYSVCAHNAAVCRKHGRIDLSRVWYLAAEILRECVPIGLLEEGELSSSSDAERDWAQVKAILYRRRLQYSKEKAAIMKSVKKRKVKWGLHPFGQKLVKNLLQHFIKVGDIQTAAMLSCTFQIPSSILKAYNQSTKKINPLDGVGLGTNKQPVRSQALHRTGSGPIPLNADSTERVTTTQLSSSYGPRGVNFLSYFWDSSPQGSKITEPSFETSAAAAVTSSSPKSFARPFSGAFAMQRLPSNTAPGLRNPPGSPHTPTTLIPPIPLTSTIVASKVFDKEGKTVHSEEMTIEFTNLDSLDVHQAYPYTSDVPLIDPMDAAQLDILRLSYADMLYRWGLLEQRAQVLKFLTKVPAFSKDNNQLAEQATMTTATMQIQIRCYVCGFEISDRERVCYNCRKRRNQIKCSLCHVLVKGTVNFCMKCGHGGHSTHIKQWFQQSDVCPTGCGCACILDN